jgi:hypothetical protein
MMRHTLPPQESTAATTVMIMIQIDPLAGRTSTHERGGVLQLNKQEAIQRVFQKAGSR